MASPAGGASEGGNNIVGVNGAASGSYTYLCTVCGAPLTPQEQRHCVGNADYFCRACPPVAPCGHHACALCAQFVLVNLYLDDGRGGRVMRTRAQLTVHRTMSWASFVELVFAELQTPPPESRDTLRMWVDNHTTLLRMPWDIESGEDIIVQLVHHIES